MYYLNVNEDGYLLSVYTLGDGEEAPEGTPSLDSLEGLDLSGVRINACRWDGTGLALDEERLAALEARLEEGTA